jgi:hypothetical protein
MVSGRFVSIIDFYIYIYENNDGSKRTGRIVQ